MRTASVVFACVAYLASKADAKVNITLLTDAAKEFGAVCVCIFLIDENAAVNMSEVHTFCCNM